MTHDRTWRTFDFPRTNGQTTPAERPLHCRFPTCGPRQRLAARNCSTLHLFRLARALRVRVADFFLEQCPSRATIPARKRSADSLESSGPARTIAAQQLSRARRRFGAVSLTDCRSTPATSRRCAEVRQSRTTRDVLCRRGRSVWRNTKCPGARRSTSPSCESVSPPRTILG